MRIWPAVVVFAFTALLLVPANAAEGCVPTTSTTDLGRGTVIIEVNAPDVHSYVYNDVCQVDLCAFSFGEYIETNGIPGLQRADWYHDDTCGGLIQADLWDL